MGADAAYTEGPKNKNSRKGRRLRNAGVDKKIILKVILPTYNTKCELYSDKLSDYQFLVDFFSV
jgi:hypothetical protein